jgi:Na+-transporting NADH:ubiquinone oxidoreductase subunit NqrB
MPDLASARKVMDDLLLARIEARHIHFLAKRGTSMEGLHEANVLQKTDLVHGAQTGAVLGALLGCAAGALLVTFVLTDSKWQIMTVLGSSLVGALLGAWLSSMVGSSIPNSRLKQFDPLIEEGKILLMVDVAEHSVEEIKARIGRQHPEALDRGIDPHIPVFP